MALTISSIVADLSGQRLKTTGRIAFDSSYATGGESFTANSAGLSVLDSLRVYPKSGYTFDYDSSNALLRAIALTGAGAATQYSYSPGAGDIKGSANTDAENVDTATKPTNSDYIDTLHAVTSTTLTSISNASPAVLTKAAHGLVAGDSVILTTSGTLPTGLSLLTTYYVISEGFTTGAFEVSATLGGAAINTSSAGSGTHSYTSWSYSEDLEIDIPRNVCVLVANDTAGALNLFVGTTTFSVTGTFRGAAQTDTITFTSTGGNKAVGFTPNYRVKYGVKPFDRITRVVPDNLPDVNLKIGVGLGSLIGYPVNSATGADADFQKLIKTGADLAISTLIDHTNKTVSFGTLADGNDVAMIYTIAAVGEVANGYDLSALTGVEFEALGV